MNRRRKVGSTLVLSSVAALAIVGMGLAAAVNPVTTEASFGFEFVPTPDVPTDIGVLTAPDMTNIKLVVDETSKKVSLKNPIIFTFTPDESIVDHTFELTYTFTMPENFDNYFELTTPLTGTIEADDVSTMAAETDITFTIGTDRIAGTLTGDFDDAMAAFAESTIKVSATVNDVTGSEPEDVAVESVTLDAETKTLAPSESFKLTATIAPENATDKNLTWETSDATVATVDTEGTVTAAADATDGETATITVKSANGMSDTCVITIAVPETINAITDITTAGEKYTVQGVVDAKTTQGLIVTDGNASIYVWFGENQDAALGEYSIGDEVKVSGTVSSYNGFLQFALPTSRETNDATIEKIAEGTGIKAAEPVALTKEIADSWASAGSFTQADLKEYTWSTVVGKAGNYFTLNIDGSNTVIEPSYYAENSSLIEGATYTVTGYFGGYNTDHSYAAIYVTGMEKTAEATLTGIEISGPKTVAVNQTITLQATPTPSGFSLEGITWESSDTTKATVDNGVVTGVTAGTTQITAKVGDVTSAAYEITVTEPVAGEVTCTYDFSSGFGASTNVLSIDQVLEHLKSVNSDGIIESVTTAGRVFEGYTGYTNLGFKIGPAKSNVNPELAFTTSVSVSKVILTAVAWDDSDTLTVSGAKTPEQTINGSYKTSTPNPYTYEFETPTDSISIAFGNRGFLQKIELVYQA